MSAKYRYYDFFAGGGMAAYGLGPDWRCVFANDFDPKKAESYRANHRSAEVEFSGEDVNTLDVAALPRGAHLAWASFPCQDMSLAGDGRGLAGARSGSFWGFWRLMESLVHDWEPTPIIVLENVAGTMTANGGRDFANLLETLSGGDYVFGPLTMDAVHFVPQSRLRLFIVALHKDYAVPGRLLASGASTLWHSPVMQRAYKALAPDLRADWVWWRLPAPPARVGALADLIDDQPKGVSWHTPAQTQRLMDLMSPLHRERLAVAMAQGRRVVGTIFKRTRRWEDGQRRQRAELRLDGIGGCLRTARGGSSRQTVLVAENERVRTRLLSPQEGARLMGLPEHYILPSEYNAAFDLLGDGLAVPVVKWLADHLLTPLAEHVTEPVIEPTCEHTLQPEVWE